MPVTPWHKSGSGIQIAKSSRIGRRGRMSKEEIARRIRGIEMDIEMQEVLRTVPKFVELLKEYSPALSASMCGIKWSVWRPVLLELPEVREVYSNYRHTKFITGR